MANEMNRLDMIVRIIERADAMGISIGTRVTKVLDIENAVKHFNVRLADWLAADDVNFAHDFIGIQSHINRVTCAFENHFVPRFAGHREV